MGRNKMYPRPLLDRFFRDGRGALPSPRVELSGYLAAIRRDLAELLNTRSVMPLDPENTDPDGYSVPGYGLPDFHSLSPASLDDMWLLASKVRQTIERFEHRLVDVEAIPDASASPETGGISVRARVRNSDEVIELYLSASALIHGD